MGIVEDYLELTIKYKLSHGDKTLVLMQVGSFYECYAYLLEDGTYSGSNILDFANINDMVISKKNTCVGTDKNLPIVMAGFGLPQLDKYVRKMVQNAYTVVVFSQDTQTKNTTRSLNCIYSPGTYFNNLDNDNNLNNNTICIWAHLSNKNNNISIGLSVIDIITGKLINYEYTIQYINTSTTFDQLEKYIAIYNPSEAIIITNSNEPDFINNLINYSNINAMKIHKIILNDNDDNLTEKQKLAFNCEKQKYQQAIIDRIYGNDSYVKYEGFVHGNTFANQALCFLIDFIEKHNPYLIRDIGLPIFENLSGHMYLANHSLKQLNIISDNRYDGKLSCVLSFLNNCITNSGKRKFNYDLLHPLTNDEQNNNIQILNEIYDVTEYLINSEFYNDIRKYMINIKDIERFERKLIMKKLDPKDFYILHTNLSKLIELYDIIKNNSSHNIFFNYINKYINTDITNLSIQIQQFITDRFNFNNIQNILIDKLTNYNLEDLNIINSSYNTDFSNLLKSSIDAHEELQAIQNYFSSIIANFEKSTKKKDNDTEYIKIHETNKNEPMLIGTKRRITLLKEHLNKLINKHIQIKYISKYSKKEETFDFDLNTIEFKPHGSNNMNMIITSSLITTITYNIQYSKDKLIDFINRIYIQILREFTTFNDKTKLSIISQFIALVDISQSRAYNAIKFNYSKPIIRNSDKSFVDFKEIRHCLIEQINTNELYVTNDMHLGKNYNGALIYGTNMVGKSSFIKSIGISIILAQSGMYVPAKSFIYYPYSQLFTRILGNDNIFKGLSTFAVEMSELRTILNMANQNSIILGDEVASGTESNSAHSIFASALIKLHSIKSSFIFATHFQEILDFDEIKQLNNLQIYHISVLYDKQQNKLIYDRKLKTGSGDILYGLEVAQSLDLPFDFIENAYKIRNKYNNSILDINSSRYNSKKLREKLCEICKINNSTSIHHLQFQENANNKGFINNFHKNNSANLVNICDDCHNNIHKNNIQMIKTKTSNGYEIKQIS